MLSRLPCIRLGSSWGMASSGPGASDASLEASAPGPGSRSRDTGSLEALGLATASLGFTRSLTCTGWVVGGLGPTAWAACRPCSCGAVTGQDPVERHHRGSTRGRFLPRKSPHIVATQANAGGPHQDAAAQAAQTRHCPGDHADTGAPPSGQHQIWAEASAVTPSEAQ